jgi:hypothetical protein
MGRRVAAPSILPNRPVQRVTAMDVRIPTEMAKMMGLRVDSWPLTEPAKSLKIPQCGEARWPDFRDELGQRDNARRSDASGVKIINGVLYNRATRDHLAGSLLDYVARSRLDKIFGRRHGHSASAGNRSASRIKYCHEPPDIRRNNPCRRTERHTG